MILIGQLIPVVRNPGSNSEQRGFAMETPQSGRVVVEKRGDLPFRPSSLSGLADQWVRVSGVLYRGRLIADTIEPLNG